MYAAQTFTGKLYQLDWTAKRFYAVAEWTDSITAARCIDGLSPAAVSIIGCKTAACLKYR